MDELQKKSPLGRGLSALIPVSNTDSELVRKIKLGDIISNKFQPRNTFIEEKLKELEESIRENGVIQPIIVRKNGEKYELIAGERRYLAAKRLGFEDVPAIVKNVTDQKSLEIALVENIQRDDLNPIEEAKGYYTLCEEFKLSQETVAKTVGRSRVSVTNSMRLLKLPDELQNSIAEGSISVGHAKVILGLDKKEDQLLARDKILKKNLTVRQLEKLVRDIKSPKPACEPDGLMLELEDKYAQSAQKIKDFFESEIEIKASGDKGRIIINFESEEDFDRIINKLNQSRH